MAKLVGHYFDGNGKYSTFIIEGLRETYNLFLKTDETSGNAPDMSDNWEALNKCHLGRLRRHWNGVYTMYCRQEDLPMFTEKVAASLSFRRKIQIVTPQTT
ncbi:MAG: hypothetical protein FWE74_08390 [Oscillospiraceae bacterium]|nr:hypothetical protein [Oscillospiraceae bacterium]